MEDEETCLKPLYLNDPVLTAYANATTEDLVLLLIAMQMNERKKARSQPKLMEVHLL